jgi:hypothetical protein
MLMGAALLAVAVYAASMLSCDSGTEPAAAFVHTIRERERLNEDFASILRKGEASQGIIDQLIAGQLSLREAAAALREEDEGRPQRLRLPAFKHFLHVPQEERYMRVLLLRVENELDGDPRQGEVMRRLREELERASRPLGD